MSEPNGRKGQGRNPSLPQQPSDAGVVPTCKTPTNTRVTPVESVEGRPATNENPEERHAPCTPGQTRAPTHPPPDGQRNPLQGDSRPNNLFHRLKVPLLKESFLRLRKDAAPGVDHVTWDEYGAQLDANLLDLQERLHRGSYHPQPVRGVPIPKPDGRVRLLGVPALEDKVVQQALVTLLEPVFEPEFLGFSYGFRPGRSAHDALDALAEAIGRKVDWILDADIEAFFDTIDQRRLQTMLERRVADKRLVRLVMKLVHAGVMVKGQLHERREGTPQGGILSPLLANLYLHEVLDLWAHDWRKRNATGEVYLVRYADDFVMGFQREQDARAMHRAIEARLSEYGLKLHRTKTRILRFGRFACRDSHLDGLRRPATFDFLGFTHIVTETRLIRRSSRKKRQAKLSKLREQIRQRREEPPGEQHRWLSSVLQGHYRYYGVPGNYAAMRSFRNEVRRAWHRQLQKRSQRAHWTRSKRDQFERKYPLPLPKIMHPNPRERFAEARGSKVGARCGKTARRVLSGG